MRKQSEGGTPKATFVGGESSIDSSKPTSSVTSNGSCNVLTKSKRPWYSRGGMHVNGIGMAINVLFPPIFMAVTAGATFIKCTSKSPLSALFQDLFCNYDYRPSPVHVFAGLFLLQALMAKSVHGMTTFFCIVALPCYLTSLLVLPFTLQSNMAGTIFLAVLFAMWRICVCMSVCLHRYASHAAFKCDPATQIFLNVLGCMAHQGGPVWWASMHRCHHKYCDTSRDPHSPISMGVERAFAFFSEHFAVDEEFAPKHNDTWYLRILDTWSFAVVTLEMMLAFHFFGREGLFVSYTSIWICQTSTLWFNIANHPPDSPSKKLCKAANREVGTAEGWYPAFVLLDLVYQYFAVVSSESNHQDHHDDSVLAKRDSTDCAFYSFIYPMEKLGMIRNVKVKPSY